MACNSQLGSESALTSTDAPTESPKAPTKGSGAPQTAVKTVESLENKEVGLLNELKRELESLREVVTRVKVIGVKEAVDRAHSLTLSVINNRSELGILRNHSAQRKCVMVDAERVASAIRKDIVGLTDQTVKAVRAAVETVGPDTVVRAALEDVRTRLSAQEAAQCTQRALLAVVPSSSTVTRATASEGISGTVMVPEPTPWTEVVKRKARRNAPIETPRKEPTSRRKKPRAVLVERGSRTFAETVKELKEKVDVEVTGDFISRMRETRNGDLLIEVKGGAADAELVRNEVVRSCGPTSSIRLLEERSILEIRDLDCDATAEDVIEALERVHGPTIGVKVLNVRETYGAEQMATLLVPEDLAAKVMETARLRVGLIFCRARLAARRLKCYRCLGSGHESKNCGGPDRTNNCRRCGEVGHFAASCPAPRETCEAFTKTLAESTATVRRGDRLGPKSSREEAKSINTDKK